MPGNVGRVDMPPLVRQFARERGVAGGTFHGKERCLDACEGGGMRNRVCDHAPYEGSKYVIGKIAQKAGRLARDLSGRPPRLLCQAI